jgi:hypothetical protein
MVTQQISAELFAQVRYLKTGREGGRKERRVQDLGVSHSPVRVQDFRQLANVPVPLEQMFSQWRGQTPSRRQRPASVWSVRPRQG